MVYVCGELRHNDLALFVSFISPVDAKLTPRTALLPWRGDFFSPLASHLFQTSGSG